MKHWKKYTTYLFSISVFCIFSITIAAACGGDGFWEIVDSFFAPEIIREEKYTPFFRSMNPLYDGEGGYHKTDYVQQFDTINVDEWETFFSKQVKPEDLHFILYKARLGEIDSLIFYIKDNKYPIESYLRKNSITSYPNKSISKEFLFYVGFAKRCSKFSTQEILDWTAEDEYPMPNRKEINDLIIGGNKLIKNVRNPFIKERYLFQLIRMNFFNASYADCISTFNLYEDSFKLSDNMKYRSMSYAAGAHRKLNQVAEANLMYAKVYNHYDPMKETAFFSFKPKDESDWQASLAKAKTVSDKTSLWHLHGVKDDAFRAMKEIYKLEPNSELLDLLLVRAINITEEEVVPTDYNDSIGYKIRGFKINQELLKFIVDVASKENTHKPYIWNLSAGYLLVLSGDNKGANQFLVKASNQSKGDRLAEDQIRLTNIIIKVQTYYPSDKNEAIMVKELNWLTNKEVQDKHLRSDNVYTWTTRRLAEIYDAVGEKTKANCLNPSYDTDYLRDNEVLDKMIAYLNKPNKTEFDQFLTKIYPHKDKTLYDMQGVNLLYAYKFNEAKKKFLLAGEKSLESNPFVIHIKDCRDCDQQNYDGSWNNLKFINEMLSLEDKVKADAANAAKYYFKLANGYYNMTYFGNCRNLYINNAFDPGLIYFGYSLTEREKYNYLLDCSKAEEYYIKALNASSDKEFKAKCTFMAAKCEQNKYFATSVLNYKHTIRSGKYFKQLKEQYAATNYYKEVIKECGYYRAYLNKK